MIRRTVKSESENRSSFSSVSERGPCKEPEGSGPALSARPGPSVRSSLSPRTSGEVGARSLARPSPSSSELGNERVSAPSSVPARVPPQAAGAREPRALVAAPPPLRAGVPRRAKQGPMLPGSASAPGAR